MTLVGHELSHFQILEKLGEGGMGAVYKARDTRLHRNVAIKVLAPDKVADPERQRRFVREAKTASALNHPGIVTIYEVDSAEGVCFIVMEYIEGKTLDQLIGRKGLPHHAALGYAVQIAGALARAHEAGIVHRDLKPANIMVTGPAGGYPGAVKILDFGLAKLAQLAPAESATTLTADHTAMPNTETAQNRGHHLLHVAGTGRRQSRWMREPISSRSARCCLKWSPGGAHLDATQEWPPSPPS